MYQKINFTAHPPKDKPLLIWDGNCGFCHYWVIRWWQMTGDSIDYEPYQEVSDRFPDIPVDRFREAVRLVEPDGTVYSGAEAAYRTFTYGSPWAFLYDWYLYSPSFRWVSDRAYQLVADNRPMLYQLSRMLFGKDPRNPKLYWVFYLWGLIITIKLVKRFFNIF